MSDIRIGISGWRYAPWRNNFYPKGLRQKDELYFASRAVNTLEINGSFYGLQRPTSYARWYEETPEDFVFSVKASRYITHIKRLRDIEQPLANFFASGMIHLKETPGPFLWQFPPSFKFDETFIDLLRRHRVALVVADTAGRWPYLEDLTSDFVYMRLHGDVELYNSGYGKKALERWQKRIRLWSQGRQPADANLVVKEKDKARGSRDVYCYFDNTDKLFAPYDARQLLDSFGLSDKLEAEAGKMMGAAA